jgi:hypothetical protein
MYRYFIGTSALNQQKSRFEVRCSMFDVEKEDTWQAQRHSLKRLVGVEETTIASRRLQCSGKKWKRMARKPAKKSEIRGFKLSERPGPVV